MNFLKNHCRGLIYRLMNPLRTCYHRRKAKGNKCIPTIICNNCTAGVILHDLGLPFNSPTINMGIRNPQEFLYFVENIKNFKDVKVIQLENSKYGLPAGLLEYDGKTVDIVFTHYDCFETGKKKWAERYERCDFNNLYILYESPDVDDYFIKRFEQIKCKNKVILSKKDAVLESKYDFYQGFDFYTDWKPGKILEYKHWFSLKRFLDDFDYVKFLNQ